ncbi:MAG TPA: peptide chain release factor N(5)-glutamine methyltransferase [Vicinamibacterales bacterium]|nr:peptide chain release factor N(5)-glutamine methyltransferase [Vicinamibacterales bacterium]
MTFYEAASHARARFIEAGLQPVRAALDADLLARHAAGWDLAAWLVRRAEPASDAFLARFQPLVERRLAREPVAYIRGVQEFWGREYQVTPDVLIPRPETELLIERASVFLAAHPRAVVVDIGTGSGCIAITLALEHPAAEVYAVDISAAALAVATQNAARLGAGRLHFIHGSHLADAPRPIDLIVTNPPYVAERDKPALAPEVRDHEPAVALFGGYDGWRDVRAILRAAPDALSADGCLMMEVGYGQSERLGDEVEQTGRVVLQQIVEDLQGIPRLAIVTRAR